ncbi:copper amine oxidase [Ilyonectria robusta]|uniref:copper amine oxidase n=1 Tax=Ilyonectria robusta TaxID=1079257 RepID=UPI001E8EC8A7|nr:copper amine oxidase [Ilyonectria robusta]KAH8683742.1 copper amine oxidase [Ilyonectria robusta]
MTPQVERVHPLRALSENEILKASAIAKRIFQEKINDAQKEIRFKHITLSEPPKSFLMPYLDAEMRSNRDEVIKFNHVILSHPEVLAAISKLGLHPDMTVQCDTWPFGADKDCSSSTPRLVQAMLYARASHNHPESNQYSFPLPISPVIDSADFRLIRIDPLPTGGIEDGAACFTAPDAPLAHCVENEYHPDLLNVKLRDDLKPLIIQQPEGPSYKVEDGNCVSWQKWKLRVGFNWREGMTIHDVRYDGRKLFYRLSMSEMTVPYGDPRFPYHRRQAFDLGDAGAGLTANNLSLGCDCLGSITYFDALLTDSAGEPYAAPNVICLHEEDGGIGWKHTNARTDVAAVTRARILVLQSIITVGNYEYAFSWHFWQNGNIEFETRATGILATSLIDEGKTSHWGNVVSPGVLAANHQHLFCLRVDPMIDGLENTVVQEESILCADAEENPYGNAWKLSKTYVEKSGFMDAAPEKNRVFKIVNEKKLNPISKNPVGFKIVPQPAQLLIAHKDSVVRKRARFAEHHAWVTRYRDGDLWAGGKWTNQSMIEKNGVADYAARNENVRGEDLVFWTIYGLTHNPRVEDYPVMPVEIVTVTLKPADFFDRNPALDVPPSTQAVNKSVLVAPGGPPRADEQVVCCR